MLFNQTDKTDRIDQTDETDKADQNCWFWMKWEGRVEARKVGELAAEGTDAMLGYWQALKNRKGFTAMVKSIRPRKNYRVRVGVH